MSEFDSVRDEVSKDLRDLLFIRVNRLKPIRGVENQGQRSLRNQRPKHTAQCSEQIGDCEFFRPDFETTGFHLGKIEKVVDHLGEFLGRLLNKADLLILLSRKLAVHAFEQHTSQRKHGVEGRSEFMGRVRKKARLKL